MKDLLLKEFKYLYDDENITRVMFYDSKKELYIECASGYAYKVAYNNGNIETSCLNA